MFTYVAEDADDQWEGGLEPHARETCLVVEHANPCRVLTGSDRGAHPFTRRARRGETGLRVGERALRPRRFAVLLLAPRQLGRPGAARGRREHEERGDSHAR